MFTPGKILMLFGLSGACCFGALLAQQDEERPIRSRSRVTLPSGSTSPLDSANLAITTAGQHVGQALGFTLPANSPSQQAFKKAVKTYREAKAGSAEREDARELVSDSLAKLYDEHLSNQEKQIAELEDRILKLRDQLKRRREAKDKMVDLKLEMVLSQAEGLGWPDDSVGGGLTGVEERYFGGSGGFPSTISLPATPIAPTAPPAILPSGR